jgi:hypothetical protein
LNNLNSLKNSLNAGNKNKIISAIVIALFVTSMLVAVMPVKAQDEGVHGGAPPQTGYVGPTTIPSGQTADFTIYPLCFLSVSPNPIGVGQMALVNMWITFPSGEGKFMNGYSVIITKPDGTTETVNKQSYVADGTSWFQYIPTQIGAYQFQFFFAGEYYPAGYYSNGNYSTTRTGAFAGAIFNPSDYVAPAQSPVTTLNVQQEVVASWDGLMANAGQALPTEYWSHPIEPNNRNWANVAGNYPWGETDVGQGQLSTHDEYYGPFIPAVHTPHIVWETTGPVAGIIGGETGNYAQSGSPGVPSLIFMGRAYQTVTKSFNGLAAQSFAESYDIQTGKIYYDVLTIASGGTGVTPTNINYYLPTVSAVPGEAADVSFTSELYTVTGSKLYKVNPSTGAISANITIPSGLSTYYIRDGVVWSFQQLYTNSSVVQGISVQDSSTGFLVKWSVSGGSSTSNTATTAQINAAFATRVQSNVTITIPTSYRTAYQAGSYGAFGALDPDTNITVIQSRFLWGGFYGSSYIAIDTNTGTQLWNVTTPKDSMESAYRPTNGWCRQGLYIAEMERGYVEARNLHTGAVVWKVDIGDYPWGEFWMYDEAAYQDLVFGTGYVGVIAINQTSGTLAWHYADPSVPFETPYTSELLANGTTYSVQNIRVLGSGTDAMVYVQNSEHTPSQPATRGWGLIALNATTGQFMWKIMGTNLGAGPASSGYLFTSSSYDGTMAVMGKGQSATTVTAPQTGIEVNTPVVITGTVMDLSPAQPNTPAISDASMSTWMDYLHFQMPIGGIYNNITITGVPVTIYVTDPNGNTNIAGTATSDASGTFGLTWTPTIAGDYKINAAFGGSDSYGSSFDSTYATVAAAHATATPAPTASLSGVATATDLMTFIVIAIVAIIIAIAIATVLILRKH